MIRPKLNVQERETKVTAEIADDAEDSIAAVLAGPEVLLAKLLVEEPGSVCDFVESPLCCSALRIQFRF